MLDRENPARAAGLTSAAAAGRLSEIGPNEISREVRKPAWRLLMAQFNSPVIWLLLAACVVSGALGEFVDAIAIGAIVIINALEDHRLFTRDPLAVDYEAESRGERIARRRKSWMPVSTRSGHVAGT